jgi:hypothetical protein
MPSKSLKKNFKTQRTSFWAIAKMNRNDSQIISNFMAVQAFLFYKCALVAAMRKILLHLHALVKNPQPALAL